MSRYILSILFYFILNFSVAQTPDSIYYLSAKNNINAVISPLQFKTFHKETKKAFKTFPLYDNSNWDSLNKAQAPFRLKKSEQMDSIFKYLRFEYPASFADSDSCLILMDLNKTKLCLYLEENQGMQAYHLADYLKPYMLFQRSGWEWQEFILYNPSNRYLVSFPDSPVFLNDSLIYALGNYYGEGGFQFINVNNNSFFRVDFSNYEILECYQREFFFYFTLYNRDLNSNKIYYKLTFFSQN
jgi:hypothetical protein